MTTTQKKLKPINLSLLSGLILGLVVLIWVGMRIIAPDIPTIFAGTRPDNLGIQSGSLASCPLTPNCVSSQSQDEEHYIQPLTYLGEPEQKLADIEAIIATQPRAKIIHKSDDYLYAEFTSPWMGFVDDVEFYLNQDEEVIELRSASRLGESDLGVNRQRIESLREQLNS
jgi:uncharacterized protein (DUF1499 family)